MTALLFLLLCVSCAKDEKTVTLVDNDEGGNNRQVRLDIPVCVADMETIEASTTRTTGMDKNSAMQVEWGAAPDTRAEKNSGEKLVKNLYVFQFDGEGDDAKMIKWTPFQEGTFDLSQKISMTFLVGKVSAKQTVYLLANESVPSITSLGQLKRAIARSSGCMTSVPENGLPMYDVQVFDPMTVTTVPTFRLKAMVAKVNYSFDYPIAVDNSLTSTEKAAYGLSPETFSVKLKNITNGTGYGVPSSVASAYTPPGGTKNTEINLGSLTHYQYSIIGINGSGWREGYELKGTIYIPENIAGQRADITSDSERGFDVMPGATYFELRGRDDTNGYIVTYRLYLGQPGVSSDFNVRRNCMYNLKVKLLGRNRTDKRIDEQADYFDLCSDGRTANCYIVTKPNFVYGIDVKRGNGNETISGISYNELPSLAEASRAKRVWETGEVGSVIKKVGYRNNKLIITTGNATEGNAVVAVTKLELMREEILWSWHIWMLPTAPGTIQCNKKLYGIAANSVSFEMMDRNLGAFNNDVGNVGSIGLYYQWGRKDPFPSVSSFSGGKPIINGAAYTVKSVAASTYGTEKYAVSNPDVFLKRTTSDWNKERKPALWGNPWTAGGATNYNGSAGQKSIYDPCPVGYRVPPMDTWSGVSGFTAVDKGRRLKGIVSDVNGFYFPHNGYRHSESGNFNGSGEAGYWSSSPSKTATSTTSVAYNKTSNGVNYKANVARASGRAVRCIKE